jgi:hypothetical protein
MLKRTIGFRRYAIRGAGAGGVGHYFVNGVARGRSARRRSRWCRGHLNVNTALTTANVNNEETIAEIGSPT